MLVVSRVHDDCNGWMFMATLVRSATVIVIVTPCVYFFHGSDFRLACRHLLLVFGLPFVNKRRPRWRLTYKLLQNVKGSSKPFEFFESTQSILYQGRHPES
jgi:hypothetical protein